MFLPRLCDLACNDNACRDSYRRSLHFIVCEANESDAELLLQDCLPVSIALCNARREMHISVYFHSQLH